MITAELNHNPYLLHTSVKFNGQRPRINSQVEKYEHSLLRDWIEKVPQIFYDEMNGYDFDLHFTGTTADFDSLRNAFAKAGVTQGMVRLFHRNELEDAETKSRAIDVLIQWLRDNPNRKFNFDQFYARNADLFSGSYPYIIINGRASDSIHHQVSMELIKDAKELQNTVLTNTPILFVIEPATRSKARENLKQILVREDVQQNQLFFMIHPQLDTAQVKRVIMDLGVDDPQIVPSYADESILMYLRNYPITEFIREAIKVFSEHVQILSDVLEAENRESEIQNAEIHREIDYIETQISCLKECDMLFTERDNYSAGYAFSTLVGELRDQITKWRIRKTSVVGDQECAAGATEYNADIAEYMAQFNAAATEAYYTLANSIRSTFDLQYRNQNVDPEFTPKDIFLQESLACPSVSITDSLLSLKVITYEEPKYDLKALFRLSAADEPREPVRVVTCYYPQWREKALELVLPVVTDCIEKMTEHLCVYYNTLADAYHVHLESLIEAQEAEKDRVSAQLSDDERRLQEDNDWLVEFRDQLIHIERG